MAKKSTKKTTKKRSKKSASPLKTILAIVVALVALGLYVFTGQDPLGLFDDANLPGNQTTAPLIETTSGEWWDVYFTNPQGGDVTSLEGTVAAQLIQRINAAQQSIHIAAFEFNLTPVAEALIAAHQRGVDVRWITDDEYGLEEDEYEGHGQFAMLTEAGIPVRADDRSALMHNKFWIFDSQTVWTGSTNITQNGIGRNNNNVIVLQSVRLAAVYEREFEEMWNGEFGPTSTSTLSNQTVSLNDVPIQVLFAPEDDIIDNLIPVIESAQESIHFMTFSFTHDDLGQAVLNRAKAGVDVQGIFETRASETEFSEMPAMYCAGLAVRQDGNPGTFHHKVFIIDGKTLVTGSTNFSNNADESNDENSLVITEPEIAAQYLREFDRRWAEAEDPDPADMNCR
jgi:phosphatidylserine/phosphatidylglycerophosphate/cardiolipin synthase-like enzyme